MADRARPLGVICRHDFAAKSQSGSDQTSKRGVGKSKERGQTGVALFEGQWAWGQNPKGKSPLEVWVEQTHNFGSAGEPEFDAAVGSRSQLCCCLVRQGIRWRNSGRMRLIQLRRGDYRSSNSWPASVLPDDPHQWVYDMLFLASGVVLVLIERSMRPLGTDTGRIVQRG